MSDEQTSICNTDEIVICPNEVERNHDQHYPIKDDSIQSEEIIVNNSELDKQEENQNETVVIKENDQCKTDVSSSMEILKSRENEGDDENSSSEKDKEHKKKVNLVKWLKKNVHIHLPKISYLIALIFIIREKFIGNMLGQNYNLR
ncbi:uncharacterized protein DC041_0001568 [Schistosoma bovis]|uniref:Uncharacterized protein n=1 Tax=Schistosoma bovis TaxID=6184 RepID=A0A430PYF4_SCHBO|nr:uncharacterized protein DC041_0001568 [Schistosoma bovis]